MPDWKILLTAVIVLAVLAFFIGSSPSVSGFFANTAKKIGDIGGKIGIDWGEKAGENFTLYLDDFGKISFDAARSGLFISGEIQATIDRGMLYYDELYVDGFTGDGTLSKDRLELDGSASQITSGKSQLDIASISISSAQKEFSLPGARISDIFLNSTTGEIVIGKSVTKFSGQLDLKKFTGTLDYIGGRLILEGSCKSIAIPSAGIKLGKP